MTDYAKIQKLTLPGISIVDALQQQQFVIPAIATPTTRRAVRARDVRQFHNDIAADNKTKVLLNEEYAKIDYVPGLSTTLYPHQQTTVKAMLDLEHCRTISMKGSLINTNTKITYNCAVLSDPVGSGKTINILSVILLSRIPRAIPDIMSIRSSNSMSSISYVRCKFKKFIKATIVFVGVSVMRQWANAIKSFTNLKVFMVSTVVDLRVLLQMISNNTVNEYDIILVKNGKITTDIELPDEIKLDSKNQGKTPYIYNIIANLNEYCWARVVIDDFDTIGLPSDAIIVRGIFTWYISSTRKLSNSYHSGSDRSTYLSASEALLTHTYNCAGIMQNHFLFGNINVRNDTAFIQNTASIPKPKYHVAMFKNPNERYISLLASLNNDEVNRITEMLNGDAIGQAAEAAGIKTVSVANIFEKILGDKFKQYRFAGDLMEFIKYQQGNEDQRLPIAEDEREERKYGKKNLLAFEDIEYKYPGINRMLSDTYDEYKQIREDSGKAIQRVKDNIKHGTCPICEEDLSGSEESIIVKCCSTIFCGSCGIKAQNLNDRYNRLQNGRCSNCRATLTIKDLIYVGDGFNLDNITEERFEDEDVPVADTPTKPKDNTKYTAIIDIIKTGTLCEAKRADMHIPNMMKGSGFLPEAETRKVLIFANFDETLKEVIKELEKEEIKYWRLMGGAGEINDICMAFTKCNETCAMVINSTKHCSGLNLQTATDLIFAHKIMDQAIESQVAGRGHRLGRKNPLNIYYLTYETEHETLLQTHNVRYMTTTEIAEYDKSADDPKGKSKSKTKSKTKTKKKSASRNDDDEIEDILDDDDDDDDADDY